MKEVELNAMKALKELRDSVYESLSEEDKKRADEAEIEFGSKRVAEKFLDMHPLATAFIMKSVLENNPYIIKDISWFGDFIDKSYDMYGAEKTAKIVAKAMVFIDKKIKEKLANFEEDIDIKNKLDEMNGKTEDSILVQSKDKLPEELVDFTELLKSKGFDVVVKRIGEEDDD